MPHTLANTNFEDLFALFPDRADEPTVEPVSATEVPEPYQSLLVHQHHMTVTVEKFYQSPVNVKVLEVIHRGDDYARKILLTLENSNQVVQFGIVRIDLRVLTDDVREEILSGRTPLGRVLIQHDVLRTVRPSGFFRVGLSSAMAEWFGVDETSTTYGRIGMITADGKPAVRVAEILAPIAGDSDE